jgi:hypothetical protein
MTERQQFEVFAKGHDMDLTALDTMGGPLYSDCNTDYAWLAWQASRKQALEDSKPVLRALFDATSVVVSANTPMQEQVAIAGLFSPRVAALRILTTTPGEAA